MYAAPLPQPSLEERRGVVVQVGRGLVQQQDGGEPHQQRREREPVPLPSRQRGQRAGPVQRRETEAVDGGVQPGVDGPGVPGIERLQHLTVGLEQVDIVGIGGDPVLEVRALPLQVVDLPAGTAEQVGDGAARPGVDLLGQQAGLAVHVDGAVVGLERPGQHPQQRALAGAVLADHAEPLTGAGSEREPVKDQARSVADDDVDDDELLVGLGRGGGVGLGHGGPSVGTGHPPGGPLRRQGASGAGGDGLSST